MVQWARHSPPDPSPCSLVGAEIGSVEKDPCSLSNPIWSDRYRNLAVFRGNLIALFRLCSQNGGTFLLH